MRRCRASTCWRGACRRGRRVRLSRPVTRKAVSLEGRREKVKEKTHNDHPDEPGNEAGNLGETESDLEGVGEVDQGGNGVVSDDLKEEKKKKKKTGQLLRVYLCSARPAGSRSHDGEGSDVPRCRRTLRRAARCNHSGGRGSVRESPRWCRDCGKMISYVLSSASMVV